MKYFDIVSSSFLTPKVSKEGSLVVSWVKLMIENRSMCLDLCELFVSVGRSPSRFLWEVLSDGDLCFPVDLISCDVLSNVDGHPSIDDRSSLRSTRITIVCLGSRELHHESSRSDSCADSVRNDNWQRMFILVPIDVWSSWFVFHLQWRSTSVDTVWHCSSDQKCFPRSRSSSSSRHSTTTTTNKSTGCRTSSSFDPCLFRRINTRVFFAFAFGKDDWRHHEPFRDDYGTRQEEEKKTSFSFSLSLTSTGGRKEEDDIWWDSSSDG